MKRHHMKDHAKAYRSRSLIRLFRGYSRMATPGAHVPAYLKRQAA